MLATIRAEGSLLYAFRFTKSLAWLVCRVVGLWGKQTNYATDKPRQRLRKGLKAMQERNLLL